MSWVYFIVIAAFMWSITNIIDKFLVEKKVEKPIVLTIFVRSASLIPFLFVIPFVEFYFPGPELTFFIFLASLFAALGVIFYYKSVQIEEISIIIPLLQFIPIFVLFLSFFLIGEVLGFFDYVGFVIIIAGGLIISTKRLKRIFKIERVFLLMLIAGLFYAISDVSIKYVFMNTEYWSAFVMFWFLQTLILLSLLFSPKIRKEAKFYIKKIGLKAKIIIISVATVSFIAHILGNFAIKLGPVTLVDAVVNIELVFTFFLAVFFTAYFPHILKERMDRKTTIQKILGMLLIITGVLLIQVV